MQTLTKKSFALFLFLTPAISLLAQAEKESPYKVNGPATKADPSVWDTPFLWIGIIVFLITIFIIIFKKRQSPTYNRLHKY